MRDSQRLLRTIRCKQRRTVGANCVRPFFVCCELAGDRRSPLRVVGGFQCHFSRKCDYISNFLRTGTRAVPTVRRRLHRIVRNSLWLSLTHYATPPFPQKSRSARLFGCKRPHDGSLSLPTFADCGQGRALSLRVVR